MFLYVFFSFGKEEISAVVGRLNLKVMRASPTTTPALIAHS